MEKAILDLMQLIEQGKYEVARPFATEIIAELKRKMDVETSDEALVRWAKMQKIVEDLQDKLKK